MSPIGRAVWGVRGAIPPHTGWVRGLGVEHPRVEGLGHGLPEGNAQGHKVPTRRGDTARPTGKGRAAAATRHARGRVRESGGGVPPA